MSKNISIAKVFDPLGLFTPSKKPPKVDTPAVPSPNDPAVEEARRKEVVAASKASGTAGTFLTGAPANDNPVAKKRLLGA